VRLEHPHQSTDGRTLVHGLGRVRLAGLDGPTGGQVCADEFDVPFACGLRARAALHNHVRGREVLCQPEGAPDGDVIPARCIVEGRDLGRLLAAEGWVRPAPTHPDLYRDEVEEARREKRGLWNGGWRPGAPPQAGEGAGAARGPG
jgi:endonuclease YncB( thermonuclease family)